MKTISYLPAVLLIVCWIGIPCAASDLIVSETEGLFSFQQSQSKSPESAIATEAPDNKARVVGVQPSGFSPQKAAFKAGGGLLLMLGFLFFVAYLAKRKGLMQNQRQRKLLLRETLSLGAKEKLAVIEFAGESMVVGITAHNIRLIRAVKKSESDGYEANPELGAKTAFDFQTKLNDFLLKGSR